jgi:magnesium and cobalt exporter, CNNM family
VVTTEIVVIFLLLVANGIFAMSEIAVVTARRVRLQQRASEGDRRATAALQLKDHPTKFLSTVQVGITLIGILAGAYSGATLTDRLSAWLAGVPLVAAYREAIALAIIVGAITYFSLVIGELVPKAIALHNPEGIAGSVATRVAAAARVVTPLVTVLSASTNLVLRALRVHPKSDRGVTEEAIRALIKQATLTGDVAPVEQRIVEQVFRLGDRRVSAIMTPRHEIDWFDIHEGLEGVRAHLATLSHPRIVTCDGELDRVLGVVRSEDLLAAVLAGGPPDLRSLLEQPKFVPATMSVFQLVETFKASRTPLALVLDEFGAIEGLVTSTDVLEGLVGEMPTEPAEAPGPIVRRDERSWLVDGTTPIEDLRAAIELPDTPEDEEGTYQTLAGLVMTRLGRVPHEGDRFAWGPLTFEVVDMDGRRVDKVMIERQAAQADDAAPQ